MITKKLTESLLRLNQCGALNITVSGFVSNRVHPTIARNLMRLGWATYGPGGVGNSAFIVPTERGREAAEQTSECNAE
jgi:hypothetical protein